MHVSLALQGGGAHGAFTWGALDRLLEQPGFTIRSISGTSSGAMNACALAQGWKAGGAEGARASLTRFWEELAAQQAMSNWWASVARTLVPHASWSNVGPLPQNPLEGLVEGFFDMTSISRGPIQVYLAATRVENGRLEIFSGERLSHQALLASACIPQWYPPVVIDDTVFWDGGYSGNPALEPLLGESGPDDLLCVLLQPDTRAPPPARASDIAERAAQLGFTAAFQRELRDFELTRQRLKQRWLLSRHEKRLLRLRIHMLRPPESLVARDGNSAVDTGQGHLKRLHALGREAADAWISSSSRPAAPAPGRTPK